MTGITASELRGLLEQEQGAEAPLLLDVGEGSLAADVPALINADILHVPLGELSGRINEFEPYRGRRIVTVCPFGIRSRKAATVLNGAGYEALSLRGGSRSWARARSVGEIAEENLPLQSKYNLIGWFYNFLDYPFERTYRTWRPGLIGGATGEVLEAGVGTGHNLPFYNANARVMGIDLSPTMVRKAESKSRQAACPVELRVEDATQMNSIETGRFDWVLSTFMCCVMPRELQPAALGQFARVLKPGGKFRLLEMVYSKNTTIRRVQGLLARAVEKLYGARFDRNTLELIEAEPLLSVSKTWFIKWDVYLVIEGTRVGPSATSSLTPGPGLTVPVR